MCVYCNLLCPHFPESNDKLHHLQIKIGYGSSCHNSASSKNHKDTGQSANQQTNNDNKNKEVTYGKLKYTDVLLRA